MVKIERANKKASRHGGPVFARMNGETRRGNRGIPVKHGLLKAVFRRALANLSARIMRAVGDNKPAIVLALIDAINLIATTGAMLMCPQLTA